jgi:hypothetical protein
VAVVVVARAVAAAALPNNPNSQRKKARGRITGGPSFIFAPPSHSFAHAAATPMARTTAAHS